MVSFLVCELDALYLACILVEGATLGHKHQSVHTWSMQVYDLTLLKQSGCLFHKLVDVLLEDSFILSTHL